MQIRAFVDAAFALHFDAKSHTGTVVTIGGAVVYVSLRKQKCMTGSSTEAELVGLTDNLGIVGLFREFVSFLIGEQAKVPIVYQDSTLVISLITVGAVLQGRSTLGQECTLPRSSSNFKKSLCAI